VKDNPAKYCGISQEMLKIMDPPLEKPEPKMADCSTHRFSSIHVWIALCRWVGVEAEAQG
jgi:hypothetical protein